MAHRNRAAVLGTGQTKYVAKRHDVTMAGMCREAIDAALADACLLYTSDAADDVIDV